MKYWFLIFLSFNTFAFDQTYKKWDNFLQNYTLKKGKQTLVKYSEIKEDELKEVLSEFESITKEEFASFSENEKLAFWINAYNAYTIQLIKKNYPVKSIKDLGSLFSSPWSKEFISIMGKTMSLDNIEHDTIRKNYKEPRIHFAVNCASLGCPSLYQRAFTGAKLEKQLSAVEDHFLNNKEKNLMKGNILYLSKIFDWYGDDFEKFGGPKRYFERKFEFKVSDIEFLDYDWKLNDAK